MAGLLLVAAAPAPRGVEGLWLTDDRQGEVRISSCGESVCGRIARVLDRHASVPTADANNPDPRRRGRPLVGLVTLWGFTHSGDAWRGGRAYDPKSGRSYRAALEPQPDGSLKVTGCVLFVCQSRRWTRTR